MAAIALLMIAVLLSALAGGVAFSHILEIPGKRRLPTEYAVAVQKTLCVEYRVPAAAIEVATFGMMSRPTSLRATASKPSRQPAACSPKSRSAGSSWSLWLGCGPRAELCFCLTAARKAEQPARWIEWA
jgi:hypothetical protein